MGTSEQRPQVKALDLLSAFRRPGCPLCRIEQLAADRCLFGLLWEEMGDMAFRAQLAESMGFCPEHTWQLYRLAAAEFAGETGAPILYKDVVRGVVAHLRELEQRLPDGASGQPWQMGRGRRREQGLQPARPCPVCVQVAGARERNMYWLVAGCADPVFRARYAASDGLCLSHLSEGVEAAAQVDPEAGRFMVRVAILRGEALIADLDEHIRKRAWENRCEALSEAEEEAARRAARFLGGLEEDNEMQLRRERQAQKVSVDELKQKGLRIHE